MYLLISEEREIVYLLISEERGKLYLPYLPYLLCDTEDAVDTLLKIQIFSPIGEDKT